MEVYPKHFKPKRGSGLRGPDHKQRRSSKKIPYLSEEAREEMEDSLERLRRELGTQDTGKRELDNFKTEPSNEINKS